MRKIEIEKDLFVYQFDPAKEGGIGSNIYLLVHGAQALLIDAGYEHQLKQILQEINHKYAIAGVIPSHFHPDHIDGIRLLNNPRIYGNQYAVDTIRVYMPQDVATLAPTIPINNESTLEFGKFNLRFEHAPGHSDCSMLIFINDDYVHVGDLYITMNDGSDALPFVKWANVSSHIQSLERLKSIRGKLLLGHGVCTLDARAAEPGIDDRISYLTALLETDNQCTVEEALKKSKRPFCLTKWRDFVK